MIAQRAALAGLALTIGAATPAFAQEDTPGPDGWTIREFTGGCSARFRIDGERPIVLVKTRTYRSGGLPRLSLEIPVPEPIEREYVWGAKLLAGEKGAEIGKGNLLKTETGASLALITLSDVGEELLGAGWPATTKLTLTLTWPSAPAQSWKIAGPSSEGITFDDCYARAGELLMAARPDGEAPGSGPRGAVPRTSPGRWIGPSDYPSRALRLGAQGTTRYQATIDRYGYVTRCLIISTAGNVDLDTATCRVIEQRARFYPARDEQDQAIEATITQDIVWKLP